MAERTERPRAPASRPVASVLLILAGAVAIGGYSAYRYPSADAADHRCVPIAPGGHCPYVSFWGFSPRFYLLAVVVGLIAGGLLALLAAALWFRPREHEMVGVFVLSIAAVSLLAYGGLFVGFFCAVVGGVLALVYRPPRLRPIAGWEAKPIQHPGREGPGGGSGFEAPPPVEAEAYAPLPPRWKSISDGGRPGATPPAPKLPRFATIGEAIAGLAPAEREPPVPASSAPRPPSPTRDRPALPTGPAVAPPPAPPPPPATASGPRGRAWRCPECGLSNAPWSTACTQCGHAAPSE